MAEHFTQQRCQDCQGGLVYNKKEKYWECPYCGKIYERELRFNKVQIDGLAGINDLVRSTLSRVASLDFQGAERDLLECEKINHSFVGTLIASIAVALIKSFFSKDRQQELSKVNLLRQRLAREFEEIENEEHILYDFLDSADLLGILAVVYGSIGAKDRLACIYNILDIEDVYNPNVVKFLLGVVLRDGRVEDADILLGKITTDAVRFGISTVLNSYPDSPKKSEHIDALLSKGNPDTDYSKLFDTYFQGTTNQACVVDVFLSAVSHKVGFNTAPVISKVCSSCTDVDKARRVFGALASKRLDEATAKVILDWCILECEDPEISEVGFKALFSSNSIFEITCETVLPLLKSSQDDETKLAKCKQMLSNFKISGKNIDRLLAFALLENPGEYEYRRDLLEVLLARVDSVQLAVVERYVLAYTADGEYKDEFVTMLLGKATHVSLYSDLFSKYLVTRIDPAKTRERIITIFLVFKLNPDPKSFSAYLCNFSEIHSKEVLTKFNAVGARALPTTFDQYLSALSDPSKYNTFVAELATKGSFSIGGANLVKYVMRVTEPSSGKAINAPRYLSACRDDLKAATFNVNVAGIAVTGTLGHVYLLAGPDDAFVTQEVLKAMKNARMRLDLPIELPAERKKLKIQKLVELYKDKLPAKVSQVANDFKW